MCTFVYVRFVIRCLSFFAPLAPLRLIIAWHFPKKCVTAAMLRSGKNTDFSVQMVVFLF